MNEWKTYKLGELVDSKRGITYGVVQPGEFLKGEGVPILKVNNLTEKKYSLKDAFRISSEIESKYERSRLTGNEILVSLVGSLGHIYKVKRELIGWNVVRAIGVLPIKEEFDKDWIYWFMKSPDTQREFQSQATTTVQATLNLKELRDIEIEYPEEKIRNVITSTLNSLDDKIELNLQINQTLETMTQTIFKEWFVNFNFPGFDGQLVDGLPKGWEEWDLKDFGKIVCGKTPSKAVDEYFGGEYMFLKIPDMHDSVFVIETSDTLTNEGLQSQSNKTLPPYSICVSSIATVGLVCMNPVPCQTNQQINSIVPSEPFWKYFLFFLAKSMRERFAATASGGTTTLNMNTSQFSNLKAVKPKDELLLNFDEIVSPMMERILANEYEINSLTQIRDSLLPKLMTGKIEVKADA